MTRDDMLACLRAFEIRQAVGSASVKKVYALRGQMTAAGSLPSPRWKPALCAAGKGSRFVIATTERGWDSRPHRT